MLILYIFYFVLCINYVYIKHWTLKLMQSRIYGCVSGIEHFSFARMVYDQFFVQSLFVTWSPDFDVFQAVYQGAERIAAEIASAYKNRNFESEDSDDYVDSGEQEIVIANRDWLDFGDNTNLDWKLPL